MRIATGLLWLLVAFIAITSSPASSQWTRVSHDKRTPRIFSYGYCLTYCDGVAWAGDSNVSVSYDSGATWHLTNYPSTIAIAAGLPYAWPLIQISCFNRQNAIVVSNGATFFKTTDGGVTWDSVYAGYLNQAIEYAVYVDSATILLSNAFDPGLKTTNGGTTWTLLPFDWLGMILPRNGMLYAMRYPLAVGLQFAYSSDAGATWSTGTERSWIAENLAPFVLDSCDENRFITIDQFKNLNRFFIITKDRGLTWDTLFKSPTPNYLTGMIARGRRGIYIHTLQNGILRSLDFGKTWQSIGGPSGLLNCQSLCVINDNVILAIDTLGDIWRTTNCGGYPVTISDAPTSYSFSPPVLFDTSVVLICDSARTATAYFTTGGCDELSMTDQRITGPDSMYYSVVTPLPNYATGFDSVVIRFHPNGTRSYNATYIATIGGRVVTLQLQGAGKNGSILATSDSSITFDTMQLCSDAREQHVHLHTVSCSPWRVASMRIEGTDSNYFMLASGAPQFLQGNDSIDVIFSGDSARSYRGSLEISFADGTTKQISLSAVAAAGSGQRPLLGAAFGPITNVVAGEGANVTVALTGILTTSDAEAAKLNSVTLTLDWNTDLLSPRSATPLIAGASVASFSVRRDGVDLAITLPKGFHVTDTTALVSIVCEAFVTDTLTTNLSIAKLAFDGVRRCVDIVSLPSVQIALTPLCGDRLISHAMRDRGMFTIDRIVPNPTSDDLTVTTTGEQSLQYEVFDVLGKRRLTGELQQRVSLRDLPNGNYYLRLSSTSWVQTRRVIKR